MTEIEQHIQTLNVMQAQYSHIRRSDAEWQAVEAAKDALREKLKREKGCEFCTGDIHDRTNILDSDCGEVYIDGAGHMTVGYDDVEVRFCPMCGRPLTET